MEYKEIERLMKEKGMRIADLARATGISYSTFTDWKAGRYTPKYDKLKKIADYFGIELEADKTLEIDVKPHREMMRKMQEEIAQGLSDIIRWYTMFNDDDREEIYKLMEMKAVRYTAEKKEDLA